MRCIIEFTRRDDQLPLLRMYIHHAPHYRQHFAVIAKFRDELTAAAKAAGIPIPIAEQIELWVLFIDPSSPDLNNLHMALCRAMDGNAHRAPTILKDDGLIKWASMGIYFPNRKNKSDSHARIE